MNLQVYRYGEPSNEPGLHVGVTRYLPRGIKREDYARLGYFDVRVPLLAPSRELLSAYRLGQLTTARFSVRYRKEMNDPSPRQVIRLLAAATFFQPIHLGCFCADPDRCHRTLLKDLIAAAATDLPKRSLTSLKFSSPACATPEIED